MSSSWGLKREDNDRMSFVLRWRWLGELKQSDGGFRMSVGGEEDVR